jgi:hypothetical protein
LIVILIICRLPLIRILLEVYAVEFFVIETQCAMIKGVVPFARKSDHHLGDLSGERGGAAHRAAGFQNIDRKSVV